MLGDDRGCDAIGVLDAVARKDEFLGVVELNDSVGVKAEGVVLDRYAVVEVIVLQGALSLLCLDDRLAPFSMQATVKGTAAYR